MALVAATVGAATSTTLSASSARSSRVAVVAEASTIRTCDGSHCRNSSHRKVLSVVLALSPSSCCIQRNNCVGLRSPSSSALNSC